LSKKESASGGWSPRYRRSCRFNIRLYC
jgi:hypothetical protein